MKKLIITFFLFGIKLSYAQMNLEADFISDFNTYLKGTKTSTIEGYYNIDDSKQNSHIFKRFIVALRKTDNRITLHFIDAQCYGDRKYWKTGDVYAYSKTLDKDSDTTEIILNEIRGRGEKTPTDYDLKFIEGEIQIITKGGKRKFIDHFKKISPDQISHDFPFSEIDYRSPNQEDSKSLNVEYQAGLELMFWLSKSEANQLTTALTLNSLSLAFDSLNKIQQYPIAEYNSVWHATFGLSVVFSNIIIHEFNWEWIYINNSSIVEGGWTLVSKDRRFGIRAEQIFYEKTMGNKSFDVFELYKRIEKASTNASIKVGNIMMIELPCE